MTGQFAATSEHCAGATAGSVRGALLRPGMGRFRRGLVMGISSLILALGWATGAAAQTTCAVTDVAVTAIITDANDTAGRTALASDCTTLLGLMDTLRGTASLNWANSLSMTSWDGITVSGGRVTVLNLGSRQLTGTLPAALNSLTGLQDLWLHSNRLSGSIPTLSSLTSLQSLLLAANRLSGEIPSLSSLTNLSNLQLTANRLSGEIPSLSGLTNLASLQLHDNRLTGFTETILSNLPILTNLSLNDNELSGSMDASVFPTSLTFLHLHRNQLTGSIPNLSSLAGLTTLALSDNQLTGTINASHFPASLTGLYLHRNQLTGSIPNLSSLASLSILMFHQNQLSGALPTTLGSLTSLTTLHLASNALTGGIPSQLGSLTSLARLSLCGTNLDATATLPAALETRRTNNNLTVWSCVRIEDASASEGMPVSFAVERDTYPVRGVAGATGGLTLSYATKDGTATSADYTGTADGSVTIPANTTTTTWTSSAAITVATTEDSAVETDETFTVTLSAPSDSS